MKKSILKLLFVITLLIGGLAYAHDKGVDSKEVQGAIGTMLAATPVVASLGKYNLENLKVTKAEFSKLQAKHGRLYVIDVEIDEDERYQFIVKRPTRHLFQAINAYKDDLDKANDMIIKNMVVAGDLDSIEDGIVFAALMKDIRKIMEQGKSFLFKA